MKYMKNQLTCDSGKIFVPKQLGMTVDCNTTKTRVLFDIRSGYVISVIPIILEGSRTP